MYLPKIRITLKGGATTVTSKSAIQFIAHSDSLKVEGKRHNDTIQKPNELEAWNDNSVRNVLTVAKNRISNRDTLLLLTLKALHCRAFVSSRGLRSGKP